MLGTLRVKFIGQIRNGIIRTPEDFASLIKTNYPELKLNESEVHEIITSYFPTEMFVDSEPKEQI